jgi:LL-diaminopimelate aminotransferase
MITANFNYRELPETYLFVNIARRVEEFKKNNPNRPLIRMGIGDVVLPLAPSVARAFSQAALDMATPEGFRGYGPEQGYLELRQAIAEFDYQKQGVSVDAAEIFVSDGSKCDVGHIQEFLILFIPFIEIATSWQDVKKISFSYHRTKKTEWYPFHRISLLI